MSWTDYTERHGEWREDFDESEMHECEGCGIYISEIGKNDWSDCVCSECADKVYCAYCGALVDKTQKDESDEYCCEACAAKAKQEDIFESLSHSLKPAV